jgi:D-alanine-D-alanine ligase-like ATP-grasp enzyme
MCFELLGFDIILDSGCKPYLLEVNHLPSFNTDTKLDYMIKKNLVADTLRLLSLSVEEKKRKIEYMREDRDNRTKLRLTLKEKRAEKKEREADLLKW